MISLNYLTFFVFQPVNLTNSSSHYFIKIAILLKQSLSVPLISPSSTHMYTHTHANKIPAHTFQHTL